uniref:4-coumarate--CoA ligase-like protein 5 n=1 Tax=Aegilops tauschii TaxID=37682 RepID=N1R3H6_AEGTA
MAEPAAAPTGIDPRSGFCAAPRPFHSVRSSSADALPPESLPIPAAAYAFSLLASPLPDRPALVDAATGIAVSYPFIIASVRSLAGGLWSSLGLRPGDVALVVAPSRLEVPVLHFALMSIGAVVSPANPASTPEEYAHQVALSRPVVAFAAPEVAAKLPGHVRREGGSSAGRHAAPTPPVQRLRVHDGLALRIHGGHGRAHGALRQFDFGAALRVILRYRVTLLPAAPPVLVAMIKSKEARHGDLSSLLVIAVGGAPLGRDVAERFAAVFTNVQVVQVKHETPCRLQNTTESSMQAGQEEEG